MGELTSSPLHIYILLIFVCSERYKRYVEDQQALRSAIEENGHRINNNETQVEALTLTATFVPNLHHHNRLAHQFAGNMTAYLVDLETL